MISVFDHPWLGGLFADQEASSLWSVETQLSHYAAFEIALAHALELTGRVAMGHGTQAAIAIADVVPDLSELQRGTGKDGLPIPALVCQMRDAAGSAASAVHTGATSQDVLDSALSLTLRSLTDLLASRLSDLQKALSSLKDQFGSRSMMGRTRMQTALPIKVMDRLETWTAPVGEHLTRLDVLRPRIERLQLGGAVGTGADFGVDHGEIIQHMARDLGLNPAPHVWHADRTAIAEYGSCLSLITGSLGKMGQDLCLMAQQGIPQVALAGGGGSSAMPHKANPVLAELLVTLSRFNAVQLSGLHHSLVHEQERSGAAWMLEWMVLPPMSVATCRSIAAASDLCLQITRLGENE